MGVAVALSRIWRDVLGSPRSFVMNEVAGSSLIPRDLRVAIWRSLGIEVGTANIWPHVVVRGRNLSIGHGVMVNSRCYLDATEQITLGAGCALGQDVRLITTSHQIGKSSQRAGPPSAAPILVGEGAWLGANVTVLPGVVVGSGAVVGAGSTVIGDLAEDAIYVGSPARLIRRL